MNDIINISGVDCYEKDGTAYLRLDTVARGLGFVKKADSGNEVVNWTRVRGYLADLGVVQKCTTGDFIPENIFYRLAMKAKNAAAEAFQAKIAYEVIPSIRKHGAYMTEQTIDRILSDPDTIIKLATDLKAERAKRKELEAKEQANAPKVLFAESVTASHTSILIFDLAKLIQQNGVDIGGNRLFQWMRDNGYLVKRKGTDYNMPTQKAMEMGLFEVKETAVTHSDGHTTVNRTPKVTGRGQVYFISKFLKKKTAV